MADRLTNNLRKDKDLSTKKGTEKVSKERSAIISYFFQIRPKENLVVCLA